MAISKRLRYEILRRDNHQCRYCGATASDTKLTIDHVTPVALGGSDDPSNLVAACRDCNAGKSSSNPDEPLVETIADDALRWAQAMRQAAEEIAAASGATEKVLKAVRTKWNRLESSYRDELPDDWAGTVVAFHKAGLSRDDLLEMVDAAFHKQFIKNRWAYFYGCCRKRLQAIQDRASEIIGLNHVPDDQPPLTTCWPHAEIDKVVRSAEDFASGWLTQESIDSAYCKHRQWGEGDCGDPICRIARARDLSWMADSNLLDSYRDDAVIEEAEALLDG